MNDKRRDEQREEETERRPNKRHALSNQGGPVKTDGDPQAARWLASAMEKSSEEPDSLTHGFHSYPAKMHPEIAGAVLDAFEGATVLDPFCGSGTVLVEARIRGMEATGVDLDRIGLRVAEIKTSWVGDAARERFLQTAYAVKEASFERVQDRVKVMARLHPQDRQAFDVHVLKEMAGLLEEIRKVNHRLDMRALEMVFSSNVVKVSNRQSDTSNKIIKKRIRKGLVTEFFDRKATELAERWEAFADVAPARSARCKILEGDALRLSQVTRGGKYDLLLSSPPYAGTYNYIDHHDLRRAWLKISGKDLARHELGARRDFRGEMALQQWDEQVVEMLRSMKSVLAPGGTIVLLVGDGQMGGARVRAEKQLRALAGKAGLRYLASASQRRADYTGAKSRFEHLVALQHADRSRSDE